MTQKVELKIYKEKSILDITEKNALYCIKGDNDTTFRIFVTDKFGNIVYLKDDTGGGGGTITNIISSDATLEISGTTVKDIKVASSVLSTINSALQAGDNVSALVNDSNYITLADIPAFNPSDYDLGDFTNSSVDPFARISDITVSGSTNLGYAASPTQGTVTSDTGTDATIPLANNTNAGLLSPTEKSKLAGIENGAEVNNISDVNATDLTDGGDTTLHHHDSRYYTETETDSFLNNKVDKVTGKQLSTEDYTTAEKTKLAGIADGAEVNVNADWNATSGDAQILNKPDLSQFETTSQLNTRDTNNRNRANHTGTQLASTISDFNSAVSSNSDVTANTSARHTHSNLTDLDAVTGVNTGDETNSSIITKIGYTPANVENTNRVLKSIFTGNAVTTTETVVGYCQVGGIGLGNNFSLRCFLRSQKSSTTSQGNLKFYLNTNPDLSGSPVQIAVNASTSAIIIPLERTFIYSGGNLYGWSSTNNAPTDVANSTVAETVTTVDMTTTRYIVATLQTTGTAGSTLNGRDFKVIVEPNVA